MLSRSMIRYVYASHGWTRGGSTRTDFDALASVAIMRRGAELRKLREGDDFAIDLIDYYAEGIDALQKWRDVTIVLADIPPETLARPGRPETTTRLVETLSNLKAAGNRLHLIDHHPMERQSMERFEKYVEEKLIESATLSKMDHDEDQRRTHLQKQCATEMVRDWLRERWGVPDDDIIDEITRFAHDQDFGVRHIPDANRLSAVIGADFPPSEIIQSLSRGEFWNPRFQLAWERQEEDTRRQIQEVRTLWRVWRFPTGRALGVVYALMPARDVLKVTPAGIHCLEELGADIAVMVQREAFISVRVRHNVNDFHAGRMLSAFGGGGHVGAGSAGGRNGQLPYGQAHERNFEDVVESLDKALAFHADVNSSWADGPWRHENT